MERMPGGGGNDTENITEILRADTIVEGRGVALRVEQTLWKAYPFVWYEMEEQGSGARVYVQVLHEIFPSINPFRSRWEARVKTLAGLVNGASSINFAYDQDVWAMAIYRPLPPEIPVDTDPKQIVGELLHALADIHDRGEFIGALAEHGVVYDGGPRLYDLSVVPLLGCAPANMLGNLRRGYPHLHPDLVPSKTPTVATDLYAVASWALSKFPEAFGDDSPLHAILDREPETDLWTARDLRHRLLGEEQEAIPMPLPELPAAPHEVEAPPEPESAAWEDAATGDFRSGSQTDSVTESFEAPPAAAPSAAAEAPSAPIIEPRRAAPPAPEGVDVSIQGAKMRLALTLAVLGLVAFVLAIVLTNLLVAPRIADPRAGLKPAEAKARNAFQNRLRKDQEGVR